MWYSESTGVINSPRPITVGSVHYPASIFRKWSKEQLLGIGIYPARVVTPDSRFYSNGVETSELQGDEWVINYDPVEKDWVDLKADILKQLDALEFSALQPSDWMVIRKADCGTALAEEWSTYRNAVRTFHETLETAAKEIGSLNDVKAWKDYVITEQRYTTDGDGGYTTNVKSINYMVDRTNFNWPVSPDAEQTDEGHVGYSV